MTVESMHDHAVALARVGYRVVPLPPGMKAPGPKNWPALATSDAATISKWWTERPQANIAIVGGNGLLLLDVDPRHGGDASLAALQHQYGQLAATLTARTPRGGLHLYFGGPDVSNSAGKIAPGLDIKSRAGYVVAPPSVTIELPGDEQAAGRYEWVDPSIAPAPAPHWLIELAGATKALSVSTHDPVTFKLRSIDGEPLADVMSALDHLATVPEIASNALWAQVGYALLSLEDQGREMFCDWSERAPGYTLGAPEHWWDTHKAENARSDYRRVFNIAQEHGWINPRSRAAHPVVPPPPPNVPAGTPVPAPPNRFAPIDAWAFADGPDPRWRIDGLLPEQGLAMIYGASGSGKSFLALDMVMAIERGVPYGYDKRTVAAGRVVYVVAEGAGGFRKRLRAYRLHHQLPAGSPAPKLVIAAPNLTNAADVSDLQGAILAAGGADVIVIDTLHASTSGADENSAQDMGLFLGFCRSLQLATDGLVALIHHSGKDHERGARGSSAIRAAMDTEIEVIRGADHSLARVSKQRDGDDSGAMCFRLTPVPLFGDRAGTSAAVEHLAAGAKPSAGRRARTSQEQLEAVEKLKALSSTYPDGVPLEVLTQALHEARPDKRPDALKRSITRAIDNGLLIIDSGHMVRLPMPTDNSHR